MNPIFSNAIDSLRMGISFYHDKKVESPQKHAISMIYHCIELLLKEKLYRINPILIYKNIDKLVTPDSVTVGLDESICRLANLKMTIEKEDLDSLTKLKLSAGTSN